MYSIDIYDKGNLRVSVHFTNASRYYSLSCYTCSDIQYLHLLRVS